MGDFRRKIKLNQCFDVIKKMEVPDQGATNKFLRRFALTINKVLLGYAEKTIEEFPNHLNDEPKACTLINNIQQLRVQLEKMFESMGGDKLEGDTSDILNELQNRLNQVLDQLAGTFAKNLEPSIQSSIKEMSKKLSQVKGTGKMGQAERNNIQGESDMILEPIMEFLEGSLSNFAQLCEKTVLKRLLKELWKMTIVFMEKTVVLPPMSDPRQFLPLPNTKIEDMSKMIMKGNVSKGMKTRKERQRNANDVKKTRRRRTQDTMSKEGEKNLTPKQCAVLDLALDTIKQYFHAGGNGLKKNFLDKSPELQSLRYALSLYTQTTDSLIKTFVNTQTSQEEPAVEDPVGEVSIQVDLFTHPGTGEHKVTVKVVACHDLKWTPSGIFRPYVEVNLIGPHISDKRRRHTTKSKSNNWSPTFNETFQFILGNEDEPDCYELHLTIKDYCFAREDRCIGIAVLPIRDVVDQGSLTCWCALGGIVHLDETGWTILRILSQRTNDEVAKEFVKLKSECRQANLPG